MDKEMAARSSNLAWQIPRRSLRAQSVGLQRVRRKWAHKHKGDSCPKAVGLNRIVLAAGKTPDS